MGGGWKWTLWPQNAGHQRAATLLRDPSKNKGKTEQPWNLTSNQLCTYFCNVFIYFSFTYQE
jgi:hypothetical protein